jgi:hypothetical protein
LNVDLCIQFRSQKGKIGKFEKSQKSGNQNQSQKIQNGTITGDIGYKVNSELTVTNDSKSRAQASSNLQNLKKSKRDLPFSDRQFNPDVHKHPLIILDKTH